MKKNKHNCDLKSCSFCRSCLKEWLPAIDANRKNYHFAKGEKLFTEGDKVEGMYFINTGKVKVHKKWDDEKELIVRFAGKGDIVGHRGLGKDIYYPVSATALEPVTVCFIDLDFFISSLKVNHDFTFQLMMFFAEELQESERKMRNMAHMPVKGRVVQALLKLKEKYGINNEGFVDITITKQDIASYAGTTYETVFRILNELEEDKTIGMKGKNFKIINIAVLENLLKH
ncbi:MAG: Crp/Fnr family transcriptional regulator [Chitinophagaceae bacterium]|nr:Crp/Fnr family transcriptional regulator [Chitinophagaceae bacterium]